MFTCRTLLVLLAIILLDLFSAICSQEYFGCFVNNKDRILPDRLDDLSDNNVDNCITRCRERALTYAGVEYGKQCFCGDSHNHTRHGEADEGDCNKPCAGNPSQTCGGGYRTNIYSVCPRGKYRDENGLPGNCDFSCHCLDNAVCLYGDGFCPGSCAPGWTGDSCEFINCSESECEQHCEDGQREDACRCRLGYSKNGAICEDINECETGHDCSDFCNNTNGSYSCGCHPGFEFVHGERYVCTDINECESPDSHSCSDVCVNTPGSYSCDCHSGFELADGELFKCRDINECESPGSHNCSDICVNTNGSYHCSCHSGYEFVDGEHYECTDINECITQNDNDCSDICINTDGSYSCACPFGFELPENNKFQCSEINECLSPNGHNCSDICINIKGAYTCDCHPGYALMDGELYQCTDIDECQSSKFECDQNCTNTQGSYECSCFEGFQMEEGLSNVCKESANPGCSSSITAGLAGGVSAVVVVIIVIIIVVVVITRRRRKSKCVEPEKETNLDNFKNSFDLAVIDNQRQLESGSPSSGDTDVSAKAPQAAISHTQDSVKVLNTSELTNFIPLYKLSGYIDNVLRDPARIMEEYEDVRVSYGSLEKAKDEALKLKNKYKNILPYDHNTVKLSDVGEPHSDYINASFIKFSGETEVVIAAQGPTPKAVNDFWRMVWEYNVVVIAMLANCIEGKKNKCAQYWPYTKQEQYGKVTVVLDDERQCPSHTIRTLTINHNDTTEKRIVRHFHFTCWPDKGVPDNVAPFMSFHGKVQKATVPGRPTVVHCSAGVGRTGTFVAFGRLLRQAKFEGGVDFLKCLHQMREQRMQMIQTLDQYIFLHTAVMDGVAVGDTALPIGEFTSLYSNLQTSVSPVDTSFVTAQYKVLSQMSLLPSQLASAGNNPRNKMKNRTDILPADQYRERLMTAHSDYINAVSIVGYTNTDKYILTQWPLQNTVQDLWRMIYDYSIEAVIVLEDMTNRGSYPAFLPTTANDVHFAKMHVVLGGEISQHGIRTSFIRMSSNQITGEEATYANTPVPSEQKGSQSEEKQLRVFQAVSVDVDQTLQLDRVITLQNEAESFKKSASPILLISRDGGSLCGQYLALNMANKMAKEEHVVDFFCIVHQIKSRRPEFFNTEESYQELYEKATAFFQ